MAFRSTLFLLFVLCLGAALAQEDVTQAPPADDVMGQDHAPDVTEAPPADGEMDQDFDEADVNAEAPLEDQGLERKKRSFLPNFDAIRRHCTKDGDCDDIKFPLGRPWCCNNKGQGNKFCYAYDSEACKSKRAAGRG